MLDRDILTQVKSIFSGLSGLFLLKGECDVNSPDGKEMSEFLNEIASTSDLITSEVKQSDTGKLEFTIYRDGKPTGITFRGVPGGHEFNTFLLAILNADGKGLNLPDPSLQRRIAAIKGPVDLQTYISLSCTNCPDVAQALNLIALYNPSVTNTIIDGGKFPKEAEEKGVQAVPMVLVEESVISVGRSSLSELLGILETRFGAEETSSEQPREYEFDVLILGGGPGGVSAGIYSARKGLKTAIVAAEAGGSVSQTGDIENLITTRLTSGRELASLLKSNARHYGVDLFEDRFIEEVSLSGDVKIAKIAGGEVFKAPQIIISTGCKPRKIGVPGEDEYVGKGVAFCPHCDGPLFKGKDVAVIGGGNAGIEAAIDLAGICRKVIVFEFLDTLKADQVLIDKAKSLDNVSIYTSRQVTEVNGDGKRVTGITVKDRATGETQSYDLQGIFVQIGSVPNSSLFEGQLEMDRIGQIKIDRNCRTSEKGVYAAGDVTDSTYNQIVTAIGEGATAALAAFEDRINTPDGV